MGVLSAFKRIVSRECSGKGQQAQFGHIKIVGDGFTGACPGCGKVQACDSEAIILPHRK